MSYYPVMQRMDGPDWLREALIAIRDEVSRFMTTALQCTIYPKRFATAWFAGETRALNPIGYISNALVVTTAVKSVSVAALGQDDGNGLWSSLGAATLPYAYYVLLGVLCHLALRISGRTHSLRASTAVALYIGGGPGLLLTLLMHLDLWFYAALAGTSHIGHGFERAPAWALPMLLGIALGGAGFFLLSLATAFRGLHGTSRLRAVIAIVGAVVVAGMLLGALHAVIAVPLGVPHFVFHVPGDTPLIDIWF